MNYRLHPICCGNSDIVLDVRLCSVDTLATLLPGGYLAHIRREKVAARAIVLVGSVTSRRVLVSRAQVPQTALTEYPHELSVYSPESNRTVDSRGQQESAHDRKHDGKTRANET